MIPGFSSKSKSNSKQIILKIKPKGYYGENNRLKHSKPKMKKPKKHVFECGRKSNKTLNSMWIANISSSN